MGIESLRLDATPMLDLSLLSELADLDRVKPGLLAHLIERFTAIRRAQLLELQQACAQTDVDRFKALSHSLKGGSASLGLSRLSALAANMEHAPSEWCADASRLIAVSQLFDDSVSAFRTWASAN